MLKDSHKKELLKNKCAKDKRTKDGFLDPAMRSLTVAAYLRVLMASIENAPNFQLKMHAVEQMKDPAMFTFITELCDSTSWDSGASIGAKYLRLMRNVI